MSFLTHILSSVAFLIKEKSSNKYLTTDGKYILTGDEVQAIDFMAEKTKRSDKFLLKKVGTSLALDDPGRANHQKLVFHPAHGKDNQQFSFYLNRSGTFNLIVKNRKVIYLPKSGNFTFSSDFNNDEGQFVIVDKKTLYSNFFETLPIEQRRPSFDQPIRKNLLSHQLRDNDLMRDGEDDLRHKFYGDVFLPQTHKDRLRERILQYYTPYEQTI